MKILLKEDSKTRIVERRTFTFGWIVARQRKRFLFWVDTAWLFSGQCDNVDQYKSHFDIEEKLRSSNLGKKQF